MEGGELLKIQLFCCSVTDCMREYRSKYSLKKHVLVSHMNHFTFKCQKCDKQFVSKQNLREHSFIHSGTKPFKCSFCGKKFRQTSQLCLHKRIHRKPYQEAMKHPVESDI